MFCFLQMCPSSWEMSKEVQQSSLLGLRRETNHQKCYWGLLYEVKLLRAWEWVLIRHIWSACPSAVLCTVSANYSCQGRELFLRYMSALLRITEHPELEGNHKDYQFQPLSAQRTSQNSNHISESIVQIVKSLGTWWKTRDLYSHDFNFWAKHHEEENFLFQPNSFQLRAQHVRKLHQPATEEDFLFTAERCSYLYSALENHQCMAEGVFLCPWICAGFSAKQKTDSHPKSEDSFFSVCTQYSFHAVCLVTQLTIPEQ